MELSDEKFAVDRFIAADFNDFRWNSGGCAETWSDIAP
jgi:hypothetical protein